MDAAVLVNVTLRELGKRVEVEVKGDVSYPGREWWVENSGGMAGKRARLCIVPAQALQPSQVRSAGRTEQARRI